MSLYDYDAFDRLVRVENAAGISGYSYRPDGLRYSKTVNGDTQVQIWEGTKLSLELDGVGAVIDRYYQGAGLVSSERSGFYLYNAHGDVVQLSNSAGVVTKSYQYDAFGNEKAPDENDPNPFRYCGEYFDQETGTIYLRARYYDPAIGRFMSEDPHWTISNMIYGDDPLQLNEYTHAPSYLAIMQSGNLYGYALGDPVNWVDPSGDYAQVITVGASALDYLVSIGAVVLLYDAASGFWKWISAQDLRPLEGKTRGSTQGTISYSRAYNPPLEGQEPGSSQDIKDRDGNVVGRRYYGPDGRAEKDEHYTDHGNSKTHPDVPHEHDWDWSNPKKPTYKE